MISEDNVVQLYKQAATVIPEDILNAITDAKESDAKAKEILRTLVKNCEVAEKKSLPLCQDTGNPIFYVERPRTISEKEIKEIIISGTNKATEEIPLRPNAVDSLTNKNLGNVPIIHCEEGNKLKVTLLLKGGGSENVTQFYSLPNNELKAHRDMDGVKKCVLDAVVKAQGKGCPPNIIGVAIGGDVESTIGLAKQQLLRTLDEKPDEFEQEVLTAINTLGIGPMGLGGDTTALAVKFASMPRHPATYFVAVVFGCWSLRRASYG